jgi:hypothetical protein
MEIVVEMEKKVRMEMRQQGYYSHFLNMGQQGTENIFVFHMGQQ